jgi:hypothetical protein
MARYVPTLATWLVALFTLGGCHAPPPVMSTDHGTYMVMTSGDEYEDAVYQANRFCHHPPSLLV